MKMKFAKFGIKFFAFQDEEYKDSDIIAFLIKESLIAEDEI